MNITAEDIILLSYRIYLQKDVHYQENKLVGVDSEENLFKGVLTFMINSLKHQYHLLLKQ